jgi:hypothetical protein
MYAGVGVGVTVGVLVAVAVCVGVDVTVGVLVCVAVGAPVAVAVGVFVAVLVGVAVRVTVAVGVDVDVLVGVGVRVAVAVGVLVAVLVAVGVALGVAVAGGATVAVGVYVTQLWLAANAAPASIRPHPYFSSHPAGPLSAAVPSISARTSAAPSPGRFASSNAANPLTCGAAIDVPDMNWYPYGFAALQYVLQIGVPGAVTSSHAPYVDSVHHWSYSFVAPTAIVSG